MNRGRRRDFPIWRIPGAVLGLSLGLTVGGEAAVGLRPSFIIVEDAGSEPAVAGNEDGSFHVVWDETNFPSIFTLKGRRVGPDDGLAPVVVIDSPDDEVQPQWPAIGSDATGNFLVTWLAAGPYPIFTELDVRARAHDAAGDPIGPAFDVAAEPGDREGKADVAVGPSGDAIVVWEAEGGLDGHAKAVMAQRYDVAGTALGAPFVVNSYTTHNQTDPAVAVDEAGEFVVVWVSFNQDGWYEGIFGQRLDPTGAPLGPEFQVNTNTIGVQAQPDVASDGDGDFMVVWTGFGPGDGDGLGDGIYGRQFDSAGTPFGGQFEINSFTSGNQDVPSIVAGTRGDFLVAWNAGSMIAAQRYDDTGLPLGVEIPLTSALSHRPPAVGRIGHDFVIAHQYVGIVGQRLERVRSYADLSGDERSDIPLYRPEWGTWYWLESDGGFTVVDSLPLGSEAAGDIPLLGDMDGDGTYDPIVWRSSTGRWFWKESSTGYSLVVGPIWGSCAAGDTPLVGDMDGDGKDDPVVWRTGAVPARGYWYWLTSGSGFDRASFGSVKWGSVAFGDRPFLGDHDGDGKDDPTVWREGDGRWYWKLSSTGLAEIESIQLGESGDVPILASMGFDDQVDLVVWRPATATWHWKTSEELYFDDNALHFGIAAAGDVPVILDVDGDNHGDLTVWRRPLRRWYWTTFASGHTDLTSRVFGGPGDVLPDNREREDPVTHAWGPTCP